jgi:hypothetical protein
VNASLLDEVVPWATVDHVDPLRFCRYRSKSAPDGPARHTRNVPLRVTLTEPPDGWATAAPELREPW